MDADPIDGVMMRFDDPTKPLADFLAHPWPSNARTRKDGTLDLASFPNPTGSSTLDDYLRVFTESTHAFSTTAALYMSFTGTVAASMLPNDPLAFTKTDSPIQLIDIDDGSPERGRVYPLALRYSGPRSLYLPAYALTVLPPYGVQRSGGTTYALIAHKTVLDGMGRPLAQGAHLHNALLDHCKDSAPGALSSLLSPLRAYLHETAHDADRAGEEIVAATVFTTANSVKDLRALAAAARAQPTPTVRNLKWVSTRKNEVLFEGVLDLPGFQRGTIPYASLGDGGAIAFGPDGAPMVTHQETTRVSFVIPREVDGRTMPSAGWPVVLYSHGTGGSYADAYDAALSDSLGQRGIAIMGYDQVLHGTRDPTHTNPDLTFFNLFNPIAARDNVRQGTADLAVLTGLLSSGYTLSSTVVRDDATGAFDKDRVAFLGHSQGSLVGAPFLMTDPRIKASVFSGLGAILTITLLVRKDIVDFKGLLESLLRLPPTEMLDELHPVLNLIQTFIEPADAIAYAKSYLADPPSGAPIDVLIVEGLLDFASPPRGQEAFASAAQIPVVAPVHQLPFAESLLGPAPVSSPATGDERAGATFGLIQYPQETHFPIFENPEANERYSEFLRSALEEGHAKIDPGS
jgi:hypothetical protein